MFTIALNFEDGITRFIQCNAGEKCWTPPTDRRSTCRWIARTASAGPAMPLRQRRLWHGEEYLEEALSEEEADARQVLTCQMIPTSDCVIDVPVAAAQCKTALASTGAAVMQVNHLSESAIELVLQLDEPLAFLPDNTSTFRSRARRARLLFQLASGRARRPVSDPQRARRGNEPMADTPGGGGRSSHPQRPDGQLLPAQRRTPAADAGGRNQLARRCRCCTPLPGRAAPGRSRCSTASPAMAIW